jgi:hypothetical protein
VKQYLDQLSSCQLLFHRISQNQPLYQHEISYTKYVLSSVISSESNDLDIQVVAICVLVGWVQCFEGTCAPVVRVKLSIVRAQAHWEEDCAMAQPWRPQSEQLQYEKLKTYNWELLGGGRQIC